MPLKTIWRSVLTTLLVLGLLLSGPVPQLSAHPRPHVDQGRLLGDSWKTLLELPGTFEPADHPFVDGICLSFDGVVAPLVGLNQATSLRCQVRVGQPLLIIGRSYEQSALEEGDPRATFETLRASAERQLGTVPATVRLDGRVLPTRKVTSRLTRVDLPDPNLFGSDLERTKLVAVGWVAMIKAQHGRQVITIVQPDGYTVRTTIYGT